MVCKVTIYRSGSILDDSLEVRRLKLAKTFLSEVAAACVMMSVKIRVDLSKDQVVRFSILDRFLDINMMRFKEIFMVAVLRAFFSYICSYIFKLLILCIVRHCSLP